MSRLRNSAGILSGIATAVFFVCVLLFFGVVFPFHIINQEQLQLFENTWEYFRDAVCIPGGFADWTARFLTQFFHFGWGGAAIVALLLTAVQLAVARMSRASSTGVSSVLAYVLSFIPAFLLWAFLCLRFAQVNVIVALLLSLLAAASVSNVKLQVVRRALAFVLIPALYWLVGPMVIVFAALVFAKEGNPSLTVAAILVAVLCPIVAWRFLTYPLGRLLYGLNYYKVHTEMPCLPWLAALTAVAAILLSARKSSVGRTWIKCSAAAVVAAGGLLLVFALYSPQDETSIKYNVLTGKRAWNRILSEAVKKQPQTYSQIAAVNLALCKTGHMGGHMFDYLQDGVEGLIPNTNASFHEGLTVAEIYYQTGMVNNARRYCYEALSAVPDYQKSAPILMLLSEICIVNENFEAARKYLTSLSHTVFYRDWAEERLVKLDDPMDIAMVEEYAQKRLERYDGDDYIFDYNSTPVSLGQLLEEYQGNLTALNYLLSWHLLNKNLESFVACCPFEGYTSAVPKAYQEAMALYMKQFPGADVDLPSFIDQGIVSRLGNYRRDFDANRPMDFLQKQYGDTYWFYYDFK